uniref:Ribosomal biogenesis protein LAS1L-like n=1 Tax=Crassostrea virginica TaxID=6565 RepID=A0A8B8ATD1_CRAVI|nr:ribosomal biogenesis protein LAS1L-like [Crassostrea virginica]
MGKASKSKRKDETKVKMMVVPWKNKEEFKHVYEGIYSDEVRHKKQAMEKMLTWQSRAMDKLPIAIESTMTICRACISHLMAIQEQSLKDNYLKLVYEYSMAIIRFVNNVTELGQTRVHRMPLHKIAGSFGIPSWIVEMRHNATHRSIPSLAELTAGADWILEWLREDFWDAQYNIMEKLEPKETFNREKDEEVMDKVLKKYRDVNIKAIKSGEKLVNCYSELLQLLERHKSKMLYIILKKGFFIPCVSQLEELGIRTEDVMNPTKLKIPDILGKLWGPLLNILHRKKLTSAFVQLMVTMVTDKENFQNYLLCSWLQKIITSNASGVHFEECNLRAGKRKLYKYRRHIPHRLLLQKLLRIPSVYTQNVIKLLLSLQTPPVSQTTKKKIYKLMDVVCRKAVSKENSESNNQHD